MLKLQDAPHAERIPDELKFIRVAVRVAEPFLSDRRYANHLIWGNPRNWRLGFYFGNGDTRLWVPRKRRSGEPKDESRVINFAHPMGREAFPVLVAGYLIGAVCLVLLAMMFFGRPW